MPEKPYVLLTLVAAEATALSDLVEQFAGLLGDARDDAIARLTPDGYADDDEAAAEFADLTRADLLERRTDDADVVARSLEGVADGLAPDSPVDIALAPEDVEAWLRQLSALRLVIATRLGITNENPHPFGHDDDRTAVYDWLGFRLEGLVQAAETAEDKSSG